MKKSLHNSYLLVIALIVICTIFRLIPHYPNFTPIAAIALFGGRFLNNKIFAFVIPFTALFLSDMLLGFHADMLSVYISFGIIVFLGIFLRRVSMSNIKIFSLSVLSLSILSSIIFYLITNFSSWLNSPFYPQTGEGLLASYIMGIPFFYNGIIGDLIFNAGLFGTFYLAYSRNLIPVKA